MYLWDPVLDRPSKHTTFSQRLARTMLICDVDSRWGFEAGLRQMVREGRVAEAIAEARTSTYDPAIGLGVIAAGMARLGNVTGAVATARLIEDPDGRADAFIDIAEVCRRASSTADADAALDEATTAAKKIRGKGWRHWRSRHLAEIGLARSKLNQPDLARNMCRLALDIAKRERTETRDQTLTDVVTALCLIGDVETAAAGVQEIGSGGCRQKAVEKLAATLISHLQVDAGLKLLTDMNPAGRFAAFVYSGRLLARPAHTGWADELCRDLQELDRLAVRIGYGSALQDLGRCAEAAGMQQEALVLSTKRRDAVPLPRGEAEAATIAKDLALNLARTGRYESAHDVAGLIDDPSEKNRILRAICECQAEAGDLQAVRSNLLRLKRTQDQAEAMAVSAAALRAHAASCPNSEKERRPPSSRELHGFSDVVETMIRESIQLARQIGDDSERTRVLWMITAAAVIAGFHSEALVTAVMIADREMRELAMNAILRLSVESLS